MKLGGDWTSMPDYKMKELIGADADLWAEAFRQYAEKLGYSSMDVGWVEGWFANAMMAAREEEWQRRSDDEGRER